MKKRVKGGKVKHYCDKCGALLYDEIPVSESPFSLFGIPVTEVKLRVYKPYVSQMAKPSKGIAAGIRCEECKE